MTTPRTGTLRVPGATLHYEVRGSGPVLLLIPGGAADAGLYAGMAADLAARHTVVSYDPRGLSRSPLDGPLTDQRVEVWSDDARRLLNLLAPDGGASVLGCSSGAIVAVDLLARYPDGLRRVVAHEPPLLELLPDPAPHRRLFAEVRDAFRAEGVGAAVARLSEGLGAHAAEEADRAPEGTADRLDERPAERAGERAAGQEVERKSGQEAEPPPEARESAARMHANMPVFLGHMLVPFSSFRPDLTALGAVADRLVPAAGRESRGQVPFSGPAARMADLLGTGLAEFPGGHLGAVEHPKEFAERLLAVLA
ncbi:alpha/beta fold hydrolase [Streptomonospora nanhaiensis]|uniref:Pimeloyl-ACP methyl ester carboxylesterase n=1 Tax=Streptomonospora nanhaiensis TaxID=1323731 RepID=A0A853BQJ8_9ACTN|nr:alpha/beta hydrolase [Streptomonospora nanhaiensis]MBX9387853.1 alpha/beta hydrolase [Streptomonospora nanhaiensis]NYI97280.1 pimeloyl-ACP methyl ester carboxylesterase [Streptomonospora nanhaiensis]